jgi:murein tripeptide amidase MpaA
MVVLVTAKYWTYQEMWDALNGWQEEFPELMTVSVLTTSREGRELPVVALTDRRTGDHNIKPALLVDANIHAGEVAGNAAAMFFIERLLRSYGHQSDLTELISTRATYIVPRLAVDGAELYLTTPHRLRSSPRLYPYSESPHGWVPQDVNGDGWILSMRIPAKDGAFAIDELDPRVMRRREPGEVGGTYYHVFVEGRIDPTTRMGKMPALAQMKLSRREGMDFNRNFPIRWAGESGQPGAGPFPLSEPEIYGLAKFVEAHPNIAAYVALHTSGGVILRQPSTGADTVLSETDRELFTRVAEIGEKVSGYFARSNHRAFASGHEKILMPGAADDWMYDHQGVLAFTVEIWNLAHAAGARGYAEHGVSELMKRTLEQERDDLRKIYAFVDREEIEEGFFPWTPMDHPDLGPVEIGGLNPKYLVQNPPLRFLPRECERVSAFLERLGLSLPQLTIGSVWSTEEGPGIYRVVAEVINQGYLPTSSTAKGKELGATGIAAYIEDADIVEGQSPTIVGHLDGYGDQGSYAPPTSQRGYAQWVVKAQSGSVLTIVFSAPRGGRAATTVTLV